MVLSSWHEPLGGASLAAGGTSQALSRCEHGCTRLSSVVWDWRQRVQVAQACMAVAFVGTWYMHTWGHKGGCEWMLPACPALPAWRDGQWWWLSQVRSLSIPLCVVVDEALAAKAAALLACAGLQPAEGLSRQRHQLLLFSAGLPAGEGCGVVPATAAHHAHVHT